MKSKNAKQIRRCQTEWFKNHVATFATENKDVALLNWQQPGTSNYLLRYITSGSFLCVIGDAGDAVYQWSERITWDFLKSADLEYFMGKCQASEVGRHYVQWDARHLTEQIEHWVKESREDMPKEKLDELLSECRTTTCSHEWMSYAENWTEWLGEDYYEFADWGEIPNVRGVGHWVGLQMATGNTEKMLKRYEE